MTEDAGALEQKRTRALRGISVVLAVGFAVWAFADDPWVGGGPGFGATQAALLAIGVALAASALLPFAWNARAVAVVVSTFSSLLLAECALELTLAPRYRSLFEADPDAIVRLIPGAKHALTRPPEQGGLEVSYRVNRAGYRGPELAENPAARVVVYGDSFIQADYSNDEGTFALQLQARLQKELGPGIEVVNAGVASYGPDQALVRMERELPGLAPDLVVVGIFTGNDFGDLLRNKLFRLDENGELRENEFKIDPELERRIRVHRKEAMVKRIGREAAKGLLARLGLHAESIAPHAAPLARLEGMTAQERVEAFIAQHEAEYQEYIVQGNDIVRDLAADTFDADVSLLPDAPATRYKLAMIEQVIRRMRTNVNRLGVPMVLMPIPHPTDVGGHPSAQIDITRYPQYHPHRMVGLLEDIAKRQELPCVDLFTPFTRRGSAELYFPGYDDHWNESGQALAAEVVSRFVIDRGLLAAPPVAPRTSER